MSQQRIAERKTLISSRSVEWGLCCQHAQVFFVILFCLISLLFPICSAHYVIKAINVFMERLFHVAIKHIGSHGEAERARRAGGRGKSALLYIFVRGANG